MGAELDLSDCAAQSAKATAELNVLRGAFPLLREIMDMHADRLSPEYNLCDDALCHWCEMAAKVLLVE